MSSSWTALAFVLIGVEASSCAAGRGQMGDVRSAEAARRAAVIARSQLWAPTNVAAMNLKQGPQGPGAFRPNATVHCTYVDKELSGRSPKFLCDVGRGDQVLVKFDQQNGEIYGEVLTSRLLWATGFMSDAVYPVTVVCRGCPSKVGAALANDDVRVHPAVVKRRAPGREWRSGRDEGWSWQELAAIEPGAGGAPRAHRDALTLLAVFVQHTDSKPEQQRIVCAGAASSSGGCRRPRLLISDVGLTFGGANRMNDADGASVNLVAWRRASVWKDSATCVGNLPKSFTGTLADPVIGEAGRRFLARLLMQLSDRQLRDLFEVAGVTLRRRSPSDASSGHTVDEWVDAFKAKRAEIVERRCQI